MPRIWASVDSIQSRLESMRRYYAGKGPLLLDRPKIQIKRESSASSHSARAVAVSSNRPPFVI
jgi:hypothetical protein